MLQCFFNIVKNSITWCKNIITGLVSYRLVHMKKEKKKLVVSRVKFSENIRTGLVSYVLFQALGKKKKMALENSKNK